MLMAKTFQVSGISCGHCVATIERELAGLDGVGSVNADAVAKAVTVKWNEPPATWDAICSALKDIGYPPDDE